MERDSKILHVMPGDIEKTSFSIIEGELKSRGVVLPVENAPVVKRVIHTTADFDYVETLCFSEGAVKKGMDAIKGGACIVTDTNMALSGINKKALAKYGASAVCFMADENVEKEAADRHVTRASVSMEYAANLKGPLVFAVGNAPTALLTLRDLINNGFEPALVIGVPVGFVNVEYAKELIMQTSVPFIVNRGRKGGSNVAAAICNALLYGISV